MRKYNNGIVPFQGDEGWFTTVPFLEFRRHLLSLTGEMAWSRVREERDLYGVGSGNLPPIWEHCASCRVSEEACGRAQAVRAGFAYDRAQWLRVGH
jgi:hypothetical protein